MRSIALAAAALGVGNGVARGEADQDGQLVRVSVASGRTFSGKIDIRTNDDALWLRFEHGRTTMWRPIEWPRVTNVATAEREYLGDAFRKVAGQFASRAQPLEKPEQAENDARRESSDRREASAPSATSDSTGAVPRSLSISASVGNWDADAEDDGLFVEFAPFDDRGRIVETRGTLTVELIGKTGSRRATTGETSRGSDIERPVLESWTVELNSEHYAHGRVLRLSFAGEPPADNPHLRSIGAVRAKLAVPGAGVLEAIADPVRLRPVGTIGVTRK